MSKKALGIPEDHATDEDINNHYREHVNVRGSSAVHSIDYTDRNTLIVYMSDGSKCEYEGVPRAVFDAFQKADSKGKFFNASIRNTYIKVN